MAKQNQEYHENAVSLGMEEKVGGLHQHFLDKGNELNNVTV